MQDNPKFLLIDMGGTHIRLARNNVTETKSYTLTDWQSLDDILRDYAPNIEDHTLLMSFAKKADDTGTYTLDQPHKQAAWSFNKQNTITTHKLAGMHVLHDLHAAGHAVFHPDETLFDPISFVKTPGSGLRIMISIGTGLGHAFINPDTNHVHDTFGGHMPPISITHDQQEAIRYLKTAFPPSRTFIVEEIISGRGWHALNAWDNTKAPRIFAEFLGLYANMLAVGMHAFGGIYLCGGVIERLRDMNMFDIESFNRFFLLDNVPIVDDHLRKTPLWQVAKPNTTLYGLDVYAQSLPHN